MRILPRSSIVADVMNAIRQAIGDGRFVGNLPGVRTLSRELGVSVPSVLAALKGLDEEGLVEVCHGKPTRIIRSRGKKAVAPASTRKLVVLCFPPDSVEHGYYYLVADEVRRRGYEVGTIQLQKKLWNLSPYEVDRLLKVHRADVWLLVNVPQSIHRYFVEAGAACLVVGSTAEGMPIPDFEIDYETTYRHAAHQLLNHGHERILFLIGDRSADKNPKSIATFVETIRSRYPHHHHRTLVRKHDDSVADFCRILDAEFIGKPREKRPTALFIALVSRCILAQTWLLCRGFSIPGDVSILCRDGDDTIEYLRPSPTYYTNNEKFVRGRLVRSIVSLLEGIPLREHTLILPDFISGETLGTAPE